MDRLLIVFGKAVSFISRELNLGNGSTWPGHIALNFVPDFVNKILSKHNGTIILIAGTNGKTTTSSLLRNILSRNGKVIFNQSGANLLSGIASSIIKNSNIFGHLSFDYAIFEVDENSLPL